MEKKSTTLVLSDDYVPIEKRVYKYQHVMIRNNTVVYIRLPSGEKKQRKRNIVETEHIKDRELNNISIALRKSKKFLSNMKRYDRPNFYRLIDMGNGDIYKGCLKGIAIFRKLKEDLDILYADKPLYSTMSQWSKFSKYDCKRIKKRLPLEKKDRVTMKDLVIEEYTQLLEEYENKIARVKRNKIAKMKRNKK
jgi:hypothetical protein